MCLSQGAQCGSHGVRWPKQRIDSQRHFQPWATVAIKGPFYNVLELPAWPWPQAQGQEIQCVTHVGKLEGTRSCITEPLLAIVSSII